ncbi:IS1 family transposase, partial [Escherichia coli]
FPPFKKLRPQSVTSRIQPGSDVIVCAEMDEQWGYVGAKSRQRWLFYAYDRLRKTVVAHVFGERTMATLGRLMSLLSPFDVVILKWSTKTGHRVRVFSSIDFPIRLVVTHHYIRAV